AGTRTLDASYRWPMQTHGSIRPSCGGADVRPGRVSLGAASQDVHGLQNTFARVLGVERDRVRVIYMDGAGSYGANGADDAAMEAALLSRGGGRPARAGVEPALLARGVGRPVRVQWTRQEEHGLDPKGPAQLLDLRAAVDKDGEVAAW